MKFFVPLIEYILMRKKRFLLTESKLASWFRFCCYNKSPDRKQLVGQRHLLQPTIPGDNVSLWEISLEISNVIHPTATVKKREKINAFMFTHLFTYGQLNLYKILETLPRECCCSQQAEPCHIL